MSYRISTKLIRVFLRHPKKRRKKKKQEDSPKVKTDSLEKVKGDNQKVVEEVKKLKDTNNKLKEQKPAEKVVSSKKDESPEPKAERNNKTLKGLFGQDINDKKAKETTDDDLELRDFDKDLDNLIEEISNKKTKKKDSKAQDEIDAFDLYDEDMDDDELAEMYQLDMEDDEDFDDDGMTLEELKSKMPPYFFIQGKKRVKFFKDLNKRYKQKLAKEPKRDPKKKKSITINLENNKVKRFRKGVRITLDFGKENLLNSKNGLQNPKKKIKIA